MKMDSFPAAVVGEQRARAARGGLPRPRRPSRLGPPGPCPATPRPGGRVSAPASGYNWWGAAGQAAASPRRQACRAGAGKPSARVPAGNRELVRRALSPPSTRGRGAALRRWSFRPTPSRLRNVSSTASPASPRPS